jgi:DNA-binding HxlR family transcriptional regulator
MKRHQHYCPVARTLDLLGDRWSILILRELLFGESRFSDLRRYLPGISPTLLTERLQALVAHGLVTTRELAPPAARTVYTVTEKGREALPILRAMARFGMSLLPSPKTVRKIRPALAAHGAVAAYYDADAAARLDERYRLVIDGETFELASVRGRRPAATGGEPDLTVTAPAQAIVAARRGETTLAAAIADGVVTTSGSRRALRNFQRVFRLP